MKIFMKKSWNIKSWEKLMGFSDKSYDFTNFAPEFYQICTIFADIKKISISLESLHFTTFSAKC